MRLFAANRNADDGVVFAFSIAFCTEELFKKALNQVSMLLNCFVKDASEEVFPNISAPFAKTDTRSRRTLFHYWSVESTRTRKYPGRYLSIFSRSLISTASVYLNFSAQHVPTVKPSSRSSKSLKLMKEASSPSRTQQRAVHGRAFYNLSG